MENVTCRLLLVFLFVIGVNSCSNWVSIPEANYSMVYTPITSPNANTIRPLGYKVASLEFQGTKPCFVISPTGGNGRHIEVAWELDLTGTLCFKNSVNGITSCSTSKTGGSCSEVPGGASSVTYTFLCEGSNCESGVKQFWFRFVVEEDVDGVYDENWCSNRSPSYPSSLAQVPSITPPTTTTKPGRAATTHTNGWTLPLYTSILVLMISSLL